MKNKALLLLLIQQKVNTNKIVTKIIDVAVVLIITILYAVKMYTENIIWFAVGFLAIAAYWEYRLMVRASEIIEDLKVSNIDDDETTLWEFQKRIKEL